jgi:gustatory receptor
LFFTDGVVFFGTVTVTYMLFLQLARQWPNLAVEWENLEISQKHYGYPRRLQLKIMTVTTIVLTGALGINKGVITNYVWLAK